MMVILVEYIDPPFSLSGPATAALSVTEWLQLAPAHAGGTTLYSFDERVKKLLTETNPVLTACCTIIYNS